MFHITFSEYFPQCMQMSTHEQKMLDKLWLTGGYLSDSSSSVFLESLLAAWQAHSDGKASRLHAKLSSANWLLALVSYLPDRQETALIFSSNSLKDGGKEHFPQCQIIPLKTDS